LWPQEWYRYRRALCGPKSGADPYSYLCQKKETWDCSNYRTIALIPHASKILLRIIQERLATYIEREISEEQAGFTKGRGTRDQIANIRWILERTIEYGKTIVLYLFTLHKSLQRC